MYIIRPFTTNTNTLKPKMYGTSCLCIRTKNICFVEIYLFLLVCYQNEICVLATISSHSLWKLFIKWDWLPMPMHLRWKRNKTESRSKMNMKRWITLACLVQLSPFGTNDVKHNVEKFWTHKENDMLMMKWSRFLSGIKL